MHLPLLNVRSVEKYVTAATSGVHIQVLFAVLRFVQILPHQVASPEVASSHLRAPWRRRWNRDIGAEIIQPGIESAQAYYACRLLPSEEQCEYQCIWVGYWPQQPETRCTRRCQQRHHVCSPSLLSQTLSRRSETSTMAIVRLF